MLKNNNSKVTARLARKSLMRNRGRNLILIGAVMLSSFMIFSVLIVGNTYFQMQRIQDIRLNGADFDAFIFGGFTGRQKRACLSDPEVKAVGIEGIAGMAEKTDADDTLHAVLMWANEVQWDILKKPAMEWVKGHYPKEEHEVMVTKEALEDCGLGGLEIGDSFALTYKDKRGSHAGRFTISGMWQGHGETEVFYVSRSFFEKSGYTLEDSGRSFLYVKFKRDFVSEKIHKELEEKLKLGKKQHFVVTADTARSVQILAGMAALILITCLCAYLLIYNILYLSVSGNIRYYGLLQTVGMTERQIRQLLRKQMLMVGGTGIAGGVLLGMAVSFFLVPEITRFMGIRETGIAISFHLSVFLLSIAVTGATVFLGSLKPVKTAARISPMEALGYRGAGVKKSTHKTGKGRLLWRMAWERVCRDKRKTLVVVCSLSAGLSVFLCMSTLTSSQGERTILSNYMEADLILKNDTIGNEGENNWKPLLDDGFLGKLRRDAAVKEVHPVTVARAVMPWEPDFAELWMRGFYEVWLEESYEDIETEYRAHPEKFYSLLTGIDQAEFAHLNSTLETPVEEQAFQEGKVCILYGNQLDLKGEDVIGKNVVCHGYEDMEKAYKLEIGGLTDEPYYANGNAIGPVLIVSDAFLKSAADKFCVSKVSVSYKDEYDQTAEAGILDAVQESPYAADFSYDSKLEEVERVQKARGNMVEIGIGISVILALIGLMNYINTISANIQSQQMELAVIESVGMTGKQVKKLLICEGLLFAGGALALTATAGLFVTYLLYHSLNYRGIAFSVPIMPVLVMVVLTGAACVAVPLFVYRVLVGKKTIVDRIREGA